MAIIGLMRPIGSHQASYNQKPFFHFVIPLPSHVTHSAEILLEKHVQIALTQPHREGRLRNRKRFLLQQPRFCIVCVIRSKGENRCIRPQPYKPSAKLRTNVRRLKLSSEQQSEIFCWSGSPILGGRRRGLVELALFPRVSSFDSRVRGGIGSHFTCRILRLLL